MGPLPQTQFHSVVISIPFISLLDLKGARVLGILFLLI